MGMDMICLLGKIVILRKKQNLTENEKIELDELTELMKEENKRKIKNLNKRFGLPEDTPPEISHRFYMKELEEKRRNAEEFIIKIRAMTRESKERYKEFNQKMNKEIEQMNKDAWKKNDAFIAENPQLRYVENIPITTEKNIEWAPCKSPACPPPFKNQAKKNKLLQMSTG